LERAFRFLNEQIVSALRQAEQEGRKSRSRNLPVAPIGDWVEPGGRQTASASPDGANNGHWEAGRVLKLAVIAGVN